MAKETAINAPLGKLGHFFSDFLGSTAGSLFAKGIEDKFMPNFFENRHEQLATLFLGPSNDDERAFAEALFIRIPEKAKELRKDHNKIVGALLDLLSEMETELQDSFRQKTLQFTTPDKEHPHGTPDTVATALLLIGISEMPLGQWHKFRKVFNLTTSDLPFNPEKECQRIESELDQIRSHSAHLTLWQSFNFLSMSHPSLEARPQTQPRPSSNRLRLAWDALTK